MDDDLPTRSFDALRRRVRAAFTENDPPETVIHAGAIIEALEMSHGDLAHLLRDALKAEHPGQQTSVWTRDVYDDRVVYELSTNDQTTLFQRSYAIVDSAVTFGDPVQVVAVTTYQPVSQPAESEREDITGDLVPLVEKAVRKDGTIGLRIIAPGQGTSGYYSADMLKRDGPKAFAAGTHMHIDHPSLSEEADRPERSVTTLAGTLTSDARWEAAGAAGPGLYADAKIRSDIAPLIEELAPSIGVSIRALGRASQGEVDGQKVRVIDAIEQAKSVDFVTVPGAGGRVLDLIESARNGYTPAPGSTEDDDVSKEELEAAQTKIAESERKIAELEAWKAAEEHRKAEANLIREAHAVVIEALAKETLPAPTRDRLAGQLAADPPLKDGALDREALVTRVQEAAKAEREYLASVTGRDGVRGMGGEPPKAPEMPTLEESDKRITAALAGL